MQIVVPDEFRHLYEQNEERPVVKIPAEVLRKTALPVEKVNKRVQFLIDDLFRIMKKANGVGLAAPQIGASVRVVVVAPEEMKPLALVNPVILDASGEQLGQEGCLSIPGLYGDVSRFDQIEISALDRTGRPITLKLSGMPSRVVQHEIDHLEGVLFIDKVLKETLHWKDPDSDDE
jgi:peptide deformylase